MLQASGILAHSILTRFLLLPFLSPPYLRLSQSSSHHSIMTYGKANRSVRDAMRQNYDKLLSVCQSVDSQHTGYLSPHGLWKIINDHIMPLKFEDLRLMFRQVSLPSRPLSPPASSDPMTQETTTTSNSSLPSILLSVHRMSRPNDWTRDGPMELRAKKSLAIGGRSGIKP